MSGARTIRLGLHSFSLEQHFLHKPGFDAFAFLERADAWGMAGVHLSTFEGSEFRALWVRPTSGHPGNHILLRRGDRAFDFHGYSSYEHLWEHYSRGWLGAV